MKKLITILGLLILASAAQATEPTQPTAIGPYYFKPDNFKYIFFADAGDTTGTAAKLDKTILNTIIAGASGSGDGTLIIENNTLKPPASDANGSVIISPNGTGGISFASDAETTGTLTAAELFATTGTLDDLIVTDYATIPEIQGPTSVTYASGYPDDETYSVLTATSLSGFGIAIRGLNTVGGGVGLYGQSTTGRGVVGVASGAAGVAVQGYSTEPTALLFQGYNGTAGRFSVDYYGNERTSGTATIQGGVNTTSATVTSLTASRAVVTDGSKGLASSATTATELGYVNGVTSAIQTQINAKYGSGSAPTFTTVDTGQGAYELYAMNQNVTNASAVTFPTVDTGQGANELYDMNQNVQTSDAVGFNSLAINTTALTINSGGTITGPTGFYSFSSAGAGVLASLRSTGDIRTSTTLTTQATKWVDIPASPYGNGTSSSTHWAVNSTATGIVQVETGVQPAIIPIVVLPGTTLSKIRVKWQCAASSDAGVSFGLVKRVEGSGTATSWTVVGSTQNVETGTSVTVSSYDHTNEVTVEGTSYGIRLTPRSSDPAGVFVTVYSVGYETTARVY